MFEKLERDDMGRRSIGIEHREDQTVEEVGTRGYQLVAPCLIVSKPMLDAVPWADQARDDSLQHLEHVSTGIDLQVDGGNLQLLCYGAHSGVQTKYARQMWDAVSERLRGICCPPMVFLVPVDAPRQST